jgi:nicotinamidase-related amidase
MKFAVIIVDMLKDSFKGPPDHPIIKGFRSIIPRIKFLINEARKLGGLIIFACDSYYKEDFLFKGKIPPHAVRGSEGAEVIDELGVQPEDIVLPKRRFSAFLRLIWT